MEKYRTHLVISQKDSVRIKELSFKNIELDVSPEVSTCFWESEDGKCFSHYMGGKKISEPSSDMIPQNELFIIASSEDEAEDFLSLIFGGMLLGYPDISIRRNFVFLRKYDAKQNEIYLKEPFNNYFKRLENVGFGCLVANEFLGNKQLCYALEKYKLSLELDSFSPHSADPIYGQVFDNYDIKHEYHTRAAFAIISAFSVIEELGLEVRSSSKNPRFIDNKLGIWNPKVHSNISDRLKEAGIPTDKTFDWIYRGNPTRVEEKMEPFFGFDSEWTVYGKDVRDKTLTFPEAIHNASYLRNFIASHRFNELTQYISPYDVFNMQSLARMLIIYKAGLWDTMINRNK